MIKSLLPALLISTLNGATLVNSENIFTEELVYTETAQYQFTNIVNPEQPLPAGQTITCNTRTQFTITGESLDVLGVTYTFGYGLPSSSNNPNLKRFYIAATEDVEDNTQTYHSITWLQINIKKTIENCELSYGFIPTGQNDYYYTTYYKCTSKGLDDIYMNERWYEQNYINDVEQKCNDDLFTDLFYTENDNQPNTSGIIADVITGSTYKTITIVFLTRTNNENERYQETSTTNYILTPYEVNFGLETTYVNMYNVTVTQEVINIPDLIFTILTMPFSFISQAFNLTLFAGTQYQINISALFLGLLGAIIFIAIIKLIVQNAGK